VIVAVEMFVLWSLLALVVVVEVAAVEAYTQKREKRNKQEFNNREMTKSNYAKSKSDFAVLLSFKNYF